MTALVLIVLLGSPTTLFAREAQFTDAELSSASWSQVYVRTKVDFGNAEHMETFPMEIGEWSD